MAETVHLYLNAQGTKIDGDSSQLSLDRADSIECLYFESGIKTARDAGSGVATGKREHLPFLIRKRIDKSTPLIAKAICNNELIDAEFKFFRPNPDGDGTTEQFFTIAIEKARISSQEFVSPDTSKPASSTLPPLETITFSAALVTWTYEDGGVMHTDDWQESA